MESLQPAARVANLIIDRVGDETIVYDPENHKAHVLTRVAEAVWRLCDGMTTPEQITERLRRDGGAIDLNTVEAALHELAEANLLEKTTPRLSRRVIAGGAALMAPMVASILIPQAAAARSAGSRPSGPPNPRRPPLPPPKGGPRN